MIIGHEPLPSKLLLGDIYPMHHL